MEGSSGRASSEPLRTDGKCVTFYSYKGGVGRTLAVANVAGELVARHGMRVLVIDWDLDTPGLHLALGLTDGALSNKPGLLDYIERSRDEFDAIQNNQAVQSILRPVRLADFLTELPPGSGRAERGGGLALLPAGSLGPAYLERSQRLDWRDLYASRGGYWVVERLRLQAVEAFDIVLIDARSGRSDATLIPLVQLPDVVVMLFALNQPSISGTFRVAGALSANTTREATGRAKPTVLLAPSLVRSHAIPESLGAMVADLAQRGVDVVSPADGLGAFALPQDEGIDPGGELPPHRHVDVGIRLASAYTRIAEALAQKFQN